MTINDPEDFIHVDVKSNLDYFFLISKNRFHKYNFTTRSSVERSGSESRGTSVSEERSNPTVLLRYNDHISGHARGDAGRLPRVTGAAGAGDCGLR